MNKNPKISIITPSFNQGQYIEEAILSIINSDYKNIEFIIIDGAGKDNTVETIRKHEKNVTYWVSEPDKGQSDAINKGLAKATGDIIAWLNSDDLYFPQTLSEVSKLFAQNPETIIFHGKSLLFGEGQKNKVIGKFDENFHHKYLAYIPFPQPSMFINKFFFEKTGNLNTDLHYAMDFDLVARAFLIGNIKFSDSMWSKYRLHPTSKTNDSLKFADEWAIIFSKVLRSLNSEYLIKQYESLGLYKDESDLYHVEKAFPPFELERMFCFHLSIQLHTYYHVLNIDKTREIALFLKKQYPAFYKEQKLSNLVLKTNLFNPKLIHFVRSVKNR